MDYPAPESIGAGKAVLAILGRSALLIALAITAFALILLLVSAARA